MSEGEKTEHCLRRAQASQRVLALNATAPVIRLRLSSFVPLPSLRIPSCLCSPPPPLPCYLTRSQVPGGRTSHPWEAIKVLTRSLLLGLDHRPGTPTPVPHPHSHPLPVLLLAWLCSSLSSPVHSLLAQPESSSVTKNVSTDRMELFGLHSLT